MNDNYSPVTCYVNVNRLEKYTILDELGDGSCGRVFKARNLDTLEIVAVKQMKRKFYSWDECANLREINILCRLDHPNIVKLLEVILEKDRLYFVFEFMERSLYQTMKERRAPMPEDQIRDLMGQLLRGLVYLHSRGFFHRDLKPENLLVTNSTLKIADFGLAREFSSSHPYTEYVSTRWYRAPEVLLHSSHYTPAIDMWAMGALMAELFTMAPIFPGQGEIDQMNKICNILGTPNWEVFPDAQHSTSLLTFNFLRVAPVDWSTVIPNASYEAIDLIKNLCSWDPETRLTAAESLCHPFFHPRTSIPQQLNDPLALSLNNFASTPNLDLNLWNFHPQHDNEVFLGLTLAVNPSVPNYAESENSVANSNDLSLFFFSPFVAAHDATPTFFPAEDRFRQQNSFLSLSCNTTQNNPASPSQSSLSVQRNPLLFGSSSSRQRRYF